METNNESGKQCMESIVSNLKEGQLGSEAIEIALGQLIDGRYQLDQAVEQMLDILKYQGVSYDVFVAILNKIWILYENEIIDQYLFDEILDEDIENYIECDVTSRELSVRLSEETDLKGIMDTSTKAAVAGNVHTPAEVLIRLSKGVFSDYLVGGYDYFWENLASNQNTPVDLLLQCAEGYAAGTNGQYIISAAVGNPQLTGDMLHQIATEEKYKDARSIIPENPNARPDTLALLLEDESLKFLKDEIADHKNADEALLRKIADMSSKSE